MKLIGYFRSSAAFRVRIALNLKGIAVEHAFRHLRKGEHRAPEYVAINPQKLVPALVLDSGEVLTQSMAILEYLEETRPQPPLLPKDARGRARVRGLALIAVADGHPLVVPRIRMYMEKELGLDEPTRNRWLQHWSLNALQALEAHLASEKETGRFCHGNTVTVADICLAGQGIAATAYFKADTASVPTVMRIYNECMKLEAFSKPHPLKQPGAPAH